MIGCGDVALRVASLLRGRVRLYGLTPGKDIEIAFTGLRPGERLFEKLLNDHETVWKSGHAKILRAVSQHEDAMVREEITRLLSVSEERIGATRGVLQSLHETLSA